MTEEEFRARYKKSFLESYRASLNSMVNFGEVPSTEPSIAELLTTIDERATIAWKQYQKETKSDS